MSNEFLQSAQKSTAESNADKLNTNENQSSSTITATTSTSTGSIDQTTNHLSTPTTTTTTTTNLDKDSLNHINRIIELQTALEKQSKELAESRHKLNENSISIKTWEDKCHYSDDKLNQITKELMISVESNRKYQRDLKEAIAQKEDQEQRISTLEQRYVNLQRECSSLTDLNNRLETELAIRENSLKHNDERYKNLLSKFEAVEQKYDQLLKKNQFNSSNNLDGELTKNLSFYQEKHVNSEEKLQSLQNELEDTKMELNRARQREKMCEDHNTRLTQTVDKLLSESNERLQVHLKERMHALDEKNTMTQEADKLKKQIEDLTADRDKLNCDLDRLKIDYDAMKRENDCLLQKINSISSSVTVASKLNLITPTPIKASNSHEKFQTINSLNGGVDLKVVNNSSDLSFKILNGTSINATDLLSAQSASILPQQMLQQDFNFYEDHSPSPLSSTIEQQQQSSSSKPVRNRQFYFPNTKLSLGDQAQQQLIDEIMNEKNLDIQSPSKASSFNMLGLDHVKHGGECDWDKLEEAAKVIANVQHAFEMSDMEQTTPTNLHDMQNMFANASAANASPNGNGNGADDLLSNGLYTNLTKIDAHTDAQTIAILIQKQLEDIDNEIRLIKEEKQNTEMRAEELESRVNSLDINSEDSRHLFKPNSPSQTSSRSTLSHPHHQHQRTHHHNNKLNPLFFV